MVLSHGIVLLFSFADRQSVSQVVTGAKTMLNSPHDPRIARSRRRSPTPPDTHTEYSSFISCVFAWILNGLRGASSEVAAVTAALEGTTQRQQVAGARDRGVAATLPRERRHDISRVPTPWGLAPQQDALRGAITSYDSDGRCSYAATHKCHSSHNHWSHCRCLVVVDRPGDAEFWGDVTEEYTSTHERK